MYISSLIIWLNVNYYLLTTTVYYFIIGTHAGSYKYNLSSFEYDWVVVLTIRARIAKISWPPLRDSLTGAKLEFLASGTWLQTKGSGKRSESKPARSS